MSSRHTPTTDEKPPMKWLNAVTFREDPRLVLPAEGVFVHGGDGEPSHFRWGWVWFPYGKNHGIHIDYYGSYWVIKIWGPEYHGCKLTLPHKPTDDDVRNVMRLVWGDLYGAEAENDGR